MGLVVGVLALGMLAPQPATAALSSLSAVPNAGNSADGFQDATDTSYQNTTVVQVLANTANEIRVRYAEIVAVDVGFLGSTTTRSQTTDYNVNFTVTAPGAYRLDVTTSLAGAFTIVDDGNSASVDMTAPNGTCTGTGCSGGNPTTGTIDLSDPGSASSSGNLNTGFARNSVATISGTSNGAAQNYALRFQWTGSCTSNYGFLEGGGDECALRLGLPATYGGDSAGDYPGSGSRVQANDGHFVKIQFTSYCGNGVVDAGVGEQCDQGAANGTTSSCCTSTCQYRGAGQVCRPSGGSCDVQETCSGTSATCPADQFLPLGTVCNTAVGPCDLDDICFGTGAGCFDLKSTGVCRPATGGCDAPESCNGSSNTCPPDQLRPAGFTCRTAAGDCDVAETCSGASPNCPVDQFKTTGTPCRAAAGPCDVAEACTGFAAQCPTNQIAANGTECRAANGICDIAETCNGLDVNCPPDVFLGSQSGAFVCRPSLGVCDPQEVCDGSGPGCPADAKSTAPCRAAAGACDVAEVCDGAGNDCPADALRPSGFTCRANAGPCDVAETCTGSSVACPANAFQPNTVQCRAAAGACDLAESCTGSAATCPADAKSTAQCRASTGGCDPAEVCNGSSNACPADQIAPNGAVCRAAAGACDIAETCDGVSTTCPADSVAGAFVECRPQAGPCDVAEACDGASPACPTDAFEPTTTECRPVTGLCDAAEFCSGSAAACPADGVRPSGAVCNAATGGCDPAETCDGTTNGCPTDQISPAGAVCRPLAGTCDVAETCDGTSTACPADVVLPDATLCRASTGSCDPAETCTGATGVCPADVIDGDDDEDGFCNAVDVCRDTADPSQTDSDGDDVGDACDPCNNIVPVYANKAKLSVIKLLTPPGDDKLKFKGTIIVPTAPPIDPVAKGVRVLVRASDGSYPLDATIPGGAYSTVTKAGWLASSAGTSFTYKNSGTSVPLVQGVNKVKLKKSMTNPGQLKFTVAGKLGSYPVTSGQLPLTGILVIDSPLATTGQCGEALYPGGPKPTPTCTLLGTGNVVTCK